jgi:hypothetical protein
METGNRRSKKNIPMNRKTIRLIIFATAIMSLLFSGIIFTFAVGMRRWYSGSFFALIGILMLINAWRWRNEPAE